MFMKKSPDGKKLHVWSGAGIAGKKFKGKQLRYRDGTKKYNHYVLFRDRKGNFVTRGSKSIGRPRGIPGARSPKW